VERACHARCHPELHDSRLRNFSKTAVKMIGANKSKAQVALVAGETLETDIVGFGISRLLRRPGVSRSCPIVISRKREARALEFTFAFDDPSIRRLFAVKCLSLAAHDHVVFLDNNLGDEGLPAVFASPSNYRTHVAPISVLSYRCPLARLSAQSQSRFSASVSPVRLEPKKYDKVVPRLLKWVKMSRKRYDIDADEN